MLRTAFAALALLAASIVSTAADVGIRYTPLGYEQITSLSASTALTVPTGALRAVITAEAQAIRYRDDGTAPSATVGMPVAVAVPLDYTGTLSRLRIIEQTSGAKVNVLYYK